MMGMKKIVILSVFLCIIQIFFISCNDGKQYLGKVAVYKVDIQGFTDKTISEDGAEAILMDVLEKSENGNTPYKIGEYSCRVYKDNDHYAIEYDDEEYVLDELSKPEYGTYNGVPLVFHYRIDSQLKVENLP